MGKIKEHIKRKSLTYTLAGLLGLTTLALVAEIGIAVKINRIEKSIEGWALSISPDEMIKSSQNEQYLTQEKLMDIYEIWIEKLNSYSPSQTNQIQESYSRDIEILE